MPDSFVEAQHEAAHAFFSANGYLDHATASELQVCPYISGASFSKVLSRALNIAGTNLAHINCVFVPRPHAAFYALGHLVLLFSTVEPPDADGLFLFILFSALRILFQYTSSRLSLVLFLKRTPIFGNGLSVLY